MTGTECFQASFFLMHGFAMPSGIRVHAIIIALNESQFISKAIDPLYALCSGISVITQYDRNYYGDQVHPDSTVQQVIDYPDPDGKISAVIRRYTDEAVSRNHEMMSLCTTPWKGVRPHFASVSNLIERHQRPDYFLVVDADEIFDIETFPRILDYLSLIRPRVMRVHGYEYAGTWNRRVPARIWTNHRVGFLRAGNYFAQRRVVSLLELKLQSVFSRFGLRRELASRLLGFHSCPMEVGVFHHGGLVRSRERLELRAMNHSEKHDYGFSAAQAIALQDQECDWIATSDLPVNIRDAEWPEGLIDRNDISQHNEAKS